VITDSSPTWYKWNPAFQLEQEGSFYTDDIVDSGDGYVVDFSLGMT